MALDVTLLPFFEGQCVIERLQKAVDVTSSSPPVHANTPFRMTLNGE